MKQYLIVLVFFLLAFIGLGVGLFLNGKRLRGGCGHAPDAKHDCTCKAPSHPTDEVSKK